MWTRAFGLLALSFSLLLASSAGLAQHEHGIEPSLAGVECVVEHGDGHGKPDSRSAPELDGAGSEHQHFCLACHLSGKRSQLSSSAEATRVANVEASCFRASSPPRVDLRYSSSTLRGPPPA